MVYYFVGFFCRGLIYQAHLLKYINNLKGFDLSYAWFRPILCTDLILMYVVLCRDFILLMLGFASSYVWF